MLIHRLARDMCEPKPLELAAGLTVDELFDWLAFYNAEALELRGEKPELTPEQLEADADAADEFYEVLKWQRSQSESCKPL